MPLATSISSTGESLPKTAVSTAFERELRQNYGPSYYRARYYDPTAGRFLNEDRLGFEGGVNFYRYARNSPVLWIDPSGDNEECYSVTPNGMTEVPCVDPNGGPTCVDAPGVTKCVIPISPSPPAAPLHYHDISSGCMCNPVYLITQAQNIRTEGRNRNLRTLGYAGFTSGVLQGTERVLKYLGAGAAADLLIPIDLAVMGADAREILHNNQRTERRIRDLFAPCEN
jgi:RHS repeat-associated protein